MIENLLSGVCIYRSESYNTLRVLRVYAPTAYGMGFIQIIQI